MTETYVLTLVASDVPLTESIVGAVAIVLQECKYPSIGEHRWLSEERAIDIHLASKPDAETLTTIRGVLDHVKVDYFINPSEGRKKRLLISDMDSTIIADETLDELAEKFGLKSMVAAITQRAMRGELAFDSSLRERVALLAGKPAETMAKVRDNARINFGAQILTETMRRHGAICVLVSGGFTYFTSHVAEKARFDFHHGNDMVIKNGVITGFLNEPILGSKAKLSFMNEYMAKKSLKSSQVLAIGDGANDREMIREAGLGIGYHPQPILEEITENVIRYGDLTAALFAQGYTDREFRYRRPQR